MSWMGCFENIRLVFSTCRSAGLAMILKNLDASRSSASRQPSGHHGIVKAGRRPFCCGSKIHPS
jgi:hypothetical protein